MHTKIPAIGTGTLLHVETPLLRGAVRGSACTACPTQLLKGEDKLKNEKIREEKKILWLFLVLFLFLFFLYVHLFCLVLF